MCVCPHVCVSVCVHTFVCLLKCTVCYWPVACDPSDVDMEDRQTGAPNDTLSANRVNVPEVEL